MSDADRQSLDLAEASDVEFAEFAQRHGIAVDRLERCREYLKSSAPFHGRFKLLALVQELPTSEEPSLVLRLVRDDDAWVELPSGFPSEHLIALLEILEER